MGKKAIGFDWQNDNSARVSRFLYYYDVKYLISCFVEDVNTNKIMTFLFFS